jgi:hypothetical protein
MGPKEGKNRARRATLKNRPYRKTAEKDLPMKFLDSCPCSIERIRLWTVIDIS